MEGMEIQMSRTDLWIQEGKERVGRIEKVASTYIYILSCVKQIASGTLLNKTGSPAVCSVRT